MKNTKQFGKLRFLLYKTSGGYSAVCLELNEIVTEPTKEQALKRMLNIAEAYIVTVVKESLTDEHLNQSAPLKYHILFHLVPIINRVAKWRNEYFNLEFPILENHLYGAKSLT